MVADKSLIKATDAIRQRKICVSLSNKLYVLSVTSLKWKVKASNP